MNLLALLVGILTSLYILYRFRKTGLEKSSWAYALLIASFPLYYFGFALYAQDYQAFYYEAVIALCFFALAYLAYKLKRRFSLFLLALLSISHAVYDYFHEDLFINEGTPFWWIEFCGSIDILIGLYLLYLLIKSSKPKVQQKPQHSKTQPHFS